MDTHPPSSSSMFRPTPVPIVAAGFQLHARTGLARWLGERLDVGWAIDVLHPRARRPADGGQAMPAPVA